MLFNSIEFLIFLPVTFSVYWFVKFRHPSLQNLVILISSYIFYGFWDPRFLLLILISTIIDFFIARQFSISRNIIKTDKILLSISVMVNLGILGTFKYLNFFIGSFVELMNSMGFRIESSLTLDIILPVGISFYTFQTLSYTIDAYHRKLKPTNSFIEFATYVSFFPQLVAGPIERASNLLPQISSNRIFNSKNAFQGLRLIIFGMFKKVVIADSLAPIVDQIFGNYHELNGGVLFLGAFYFAFQIYCDFSGYSDIAIGLAKLFGFEIMSNFRFPYFSRNISEFWRKWHISLSTWFRDYVYIPLGGSRVSTLRSVGNVFTVFLLSGLWHGANLTFLAWGLFHSLLFIPEFLLKNFNSAGWSAMNFKNSRILEIFQILKTFVLVSIGWVFFRSPTISDSFQYLKRMFTELELPNTFRSPIVMYIIPFIVLDFYHRKDERLSSLRPIDLVECYILVYLIILFFGQEASFIYFQF